MSSSSRTTEACQSAPATLLDEEIRLVSHRFVDNPVLDVRTSIIRNCEQREIAEYSLIAGEMCLNMALSPARHDYSPPELWLMRAKQNWEQTIDKNESGINATFGRAATQLALADIYESQSRGVIPEIEERYQAYRNIVKVAAAQAQEEQNSTDEDALRLGELGELDLYLLLERFSLRNNDTNWMTLRSLLCEDKAKPIRGVRTAWDLSVFTQYEPESNPQLHYRVQAKASRSAKLYTSNIAVISVANDLRLPNGGSSSSHLAPVWEIAADCYNEVYSNDPHLVFQSQQRLNLRESMLLDLIDSRTD